MPIAVISMAIILYTYSVTSIRAARRNAQLHREADGGQLDMRRESLRRHGVLEAVQGTKGVDLFRDAGPEAKNEKEFLTEKRAKNLGSEQVGQERVGSRTGVETELEGYKGLATSAAVKKFKESKEA